MIAPFLGMFACVSMSVVAVCLAVLYRRAGHGNMVVAWLWGLAIVMAVSVSVHLITFFGHEQVLPLYDRNPGWRWLGAFGFLMLGPASLVTFLLTIWFAAKRWPIDGLRATKRTSTGAAPQDGKG
ncbi:MAG: hypothetical protein CSA74_00320 [Rhodobacterales bacterium]|nr:MAG: hypothetical protein CSA74_00320 [Rhodobacterales bacterium]